MGKWFSYTGDSGRWAHSPFTAFVAKRKGFIQTPNGQQCRYSSLVGFLGLSLSLSSIRSRPPTTTIAFSLGLWWSGTCFVSRFLLYTTSHVYYCLRVIAMKSLETRYMYLCSLLKHVTVFHYRCMSWYSIIGGCCAHTWTIWVSMASTAPADITYKSPKNKEYSAGPSENSVHQL